MGFFGKKRWSKVNLGTKGEVLHANPKVAKLQRLRVERIREEGQAKMRLAEAKEKHLLKRARKSGRQNLNWHKGISHGAAGVAGLLRGGDKLLTGLGSMGRAYNQPVNKGKRGRKRKNSEADFLGLGNLRI